MTKSVNISDDLYEKITIYSKAMNPKQSIDVTTEEIIEVGIASLNLQFAIKELMKKNVNTQG
jgi:hypothetical protein